MMDVPAPFLRAVAIAVQGLMSRTPQRGAKSVLRINRRGEIPLIVETSMALVSRSNRKRTRIYHLTCNVKGRAFSLHYSAETGQWFADETSSLNTKKLEPRDSGSAFYEQNYVVLTQKEIEDDFAARFTTPYHVERVSDEAVFGAKYLMEDMEVYS